MKTVLIISDAWHPQINGVVRTLEQVRKGLEQRSIRVEMISPADFLSLPCPTYPEIRLALSTPWALARMMKAKAADAIHIATEGPLGQIARLICRWYRWPFTTSFHTRFPEYMAERWPIPAWLIYPLIRRFHAKAEATLVPTPSIAAALESKGFGKLRIWTRGVERTLFKPKRNFSLDLPRPIFLNVGRVAVEKNLEAFLALDLPGSKVVVGDGPERHRLEQDYPEVFFLGQKQGEALADIYAASDVFVFPSKTDTFGLVVLEAIASGLPVAAFHAPGVCDILAATKAGVLADDLQHAALAALKMGRVDPDQALEAYTWEKCTDIFEQTLVPLAK